MTPSLLPGQPHVAYRGDQLFVEDVCLADLARTYGTPLFVYSKAAMLSALAAYQRGFAGRKVQICYAMKANSSLAVLQTVCPGRLRLRHRVGRRTRARAGRRRRRREGHFLRRRQDPRRNAPALQVGHWLLQRRKRSRTGRAERRGHRVAAQRAPVSIRVNPNVDPKTHPYISTGLKGNKFGVAHERALADLPARRRAARPAGGGHRLPHRLADHARSPLPRRDGSHARPGRGDRGRRHSDRATSILAAAWASTTTATRHRKPDALWARLLQALDARGYGARELMIEPGRSLVGNAGVLPDRGALPQAR